MIQFCDLLIVGLEKAILKRKTTQLSGFLFGGLLGPKFELFLFTIIGVVIYFFCYNFGTLLINKY